LFKKSQQICSSNEWLLKPTVIGYLFSYFLLKVTVILARLRHFIDYCIVKVWWSKTDFFENDSTNLCQKFFQGDVH